MIRLTERIKGIFMETFFYRTIELPDFLQERYTLFLELCGLREEKNTDYTVLCQNQEGEILACGSLTGNVLKQIAVNPELEGNGLCAAIVTELVDEAIKRGERHLFLYTKPERQILFEGLGFYPVVATEKMLMMENKANGLQNYLANLPHFEGKIGAIVCNCNPFTLGHRRLMEYAAADCDKLMVFVLSESCSMFTPEVRYEMVKAGTADLKNVYVVYSQDYLVSRATFPTYFIKDQACCEEAACELDIALFTLCIAPELNITVRYVGEEPFDPITCEYNEKMKAILPLHGIRLVEIPRFENISASKVRKLIMEGRVRETRRYLPETSYEYCLRNFGAGA